MNDPRAARPEAERPEFQPVVDQPGLPRVLLIGDSISMGYTLPTRRLLQGKANVHRPPTNCRSTLIGLAHIEEWLAPGPWDVIHFNWGLHDLRRLEEGVHQVPIEQYAENLEKLVGILQQAGARLIWASTTPVPPGAQGRVAGDEVRYNAVAAQIMNRHGIPVNDLHAFASARLQEIQYPQNVHFHEKGSEVLAEQVARSILSMI